MSGSDFCRTNPDTRIVIAVIGINPISELKLSAQLGLAVDFRGDH